MAEADARAGVIEEIVGEDHSKVKGAKVLPTERRGKPVSMTTPKKGGKGGKFTWEGPDPLEGEVDYDEKERAPIAIDENDPNYVDEQEEEKDRSVAAGVVEVEKLAPHDVAVVDFVIPQKK